MTPRMHTPTSLTAALAVAATLAATAPAHSMPIDMRSPDSRDAAAEKAFGGTYRPVGPKNGMDHRAIEAALAQEQYYESHKPAVPASGHDFRSVDARDAAGPLGGAFERDDPPVTASSPDSSGLEWGDAAIGSGATLGLVLLLAGGAATVSRRRRTATS